jgi:hypothetical protein
MKKSIGSFHKYLVPIVNLIFSSFHLAWLAIIWERVDLFANYLWIPVILPLLILLSSVLELLSGRKSRIIAIAAYGFLIILSIYIVVLVGTEGGGFKLSRVQEVLVYITFSVAILVLNWMNFKKLN